MARGREQIGDTLVVSGIDDSNSKSYLFAPIPQNITYDTISLQPEAQPNQPVSVPISFHGGLAYDRYDEQTGGCLVNTGILANERNVLRAPVKVNTLTLTHAATPVMYFFEALAPNATIAFDAASTGKTAAADSLTWSHTVGSGSNRVLRVSVSTEGGDSPSSVTYGGVAMTLIQSQNSVSYSTDIWILVNPASGAADIVATITIGGGEPMVGGATSWTGVNQTTPTGTAVVNSGTGTTATVTVRTSTGEMVVDVLACGNQTATVGADQTQKWNDIQSTDIRGAGSYQAGADGGVMSWSLGGSTDWSITAVPLLQATAPVLYVNSVEAGEVNAYKISLAYGDFGTLLNTKTFSLVTTPPQGRPAEWYDGSNTSWWLPLGDNEKAQRLSSIASGSSNDTWTAATNATANARHFTNVKDQLYELYGDNEIGILDSGQDPGINANWGRGHYVGSGAVKVTDIAQVSGLCYLTVEDGFYQFDGVGKARNILPEIGKAERNGQGLSYGRGGFFVPGVASLYWTLTGQPIGPDSPSDEHTANDPSIGVGQYFKHGRWNGTASYNGHFYGIYVNSTGTSALIVWAYPVGEKWRFQAIASVTGDFNNFHGIRVVETSQFSSTEVRPCLFFANGNDLSWIWLDKNGSPMLRRGDIDLDDTVVPQEIVRVISGRIDFGMPRVNKQLTYISGWAEDFSATTNYHTFALNVYRDGGSSESVGTITGGGSSPDGYFTKYWTQDANDECRSLLFYVSWLGVGDLTDQNGPLLRDVQLHAIAKPATTRLWSFLISAKDDGSTSKATRSDLEGYLNDLKKYKTPHEDAFSGMLTGLQLLRADEINALTPRNQTPPKYVFRATVREMPSS